jgi:hypothetical protein
MTDELKERTDIAFETGRIFGLREAYDLIISMGENEIFTKHYFSKDVASKLLELINKKESDNG